MDYAKALTFLWEDPRWKEKVAIGTGVMLVSGLLDARADRLCGHLDRDGLLRARPAERA